MLYPAFFCRECGRDLTEEIENTKDSNSTCEKCKTIKESYDQFKGIMGQSDLWRRK
ncbi:hypothetical protein [Alkalihalobacterium chitinilyticum]|uniref:Zinc ribbon domain-containing protein n=1 Tax=Alkalihalobacterium chitinilyticum TaxID=2980103 RepID=A0ABT5VBK9_9BACI|nr:hypothetical protein [Alkalihalobacterium chitinilyticum]MDE5412848.1 hypothetical protein [Alkalihalobacterium chitinilyticum]